MNYGLVLTGGGARGAYHAGVYRALKEMNKNITAVTGTSIGAVTAALIAAGENENIRRLWTELTFRKITGTRRFGRYDTYSVRSLINKIIDEDKIRRSDILFGFELLYPRTMKCGELFISDIPRGTLAGYLTAAVCMPLFRPVKIGGEKCVDGGIADNAPVDMLVKKGYTDIILSDDHGIGRERPMESFDANIIRVRCAKPIGGIMNFDREHTAKAAAQGYFDCLRQFGAVSGKIYALGNKSYRQYSFKYGTDSAAAVEKEADKLGVDKYRRYSVEALKEAVRHKKQTNI